MFYLCLGAGSCQKAQTEPGGSLFPLALATLTVCSEAQSHLSQAGLELDAQPRRT